MNKKWANCRKILCIRPDNMGDLLMSSPAIYALKNTFNCNITVLTSSMAKGIAEFIPCIDDVIVFDLPWVKKDNVSSKNDFLNTISELKNKNFDAAIIFTVYSQNPLPSVMIAYLAGIPLRLAYCRENPYELLTDWVPDQEPFNFIQHQVKRDLALVQTIGAFTTNKDLQLVLPDNNWTDLKEKLFKSGIHLNKKFVVIHAGVSEIKREYNKDNWVIAAKKIIDETGYQIIFTGSPSERPLTEWLAQETGNHSFSLGGLVPLNEFLLFIKNASLVISVNTITIHAAAATETPVIALYAFTNPQHYPWQGKGKVLNYEVPINMRSKNEIIKYVADNKHPILPMQIDPETIAETAYDILIKKNLKPIPEMPDLLNPK